MFLLWQAIGIYLFMTLMLLHIIAAQFSFTNIAQINIVLSIFPTKRKTKRSTLTEQLQNRIEKS
jgi:hypothetical protein